MDETRLGAVEARFADIIWQNAPLSSGELVKLCAQQLEWKKSTTYTVLRRLCERGIFINEDGAVRVQIGREDFYAAHSEELLQESFGGSLPAFLAAFTRRKKLTEAEIAAIEALIGQNRG